MSYTGLCIGGPYDGQTITCAHNVLRTYERPGLRLAPFSAKDEPVAMNVSFKTVDYQHIKLGSDAQFWLPFEQEVWTEDPVKTILAKLIANYRPARTV